MAMKKKTEWQRVGSLPMSDADIEHMEAAEILEADGWEPTPGKFATFWDDPLFWKKGDRNLVSFCDVEMRGEERWDEFLLRELKECPDITSDIDPMSLEGENISIEDLPPMPEKLPPPKPKEIWEEFEVKVQDPELGFDVSLCGLCGNTGYIKTIGVFSPKGIPLPSIIKPCICPNGRADKKRNGC